MQIFVRALAGNTLTLEVEPADSIGSVKATQIKDREGIPPQYQRLLFAGRCLEDANSFAECRIGPDATLHLALPLVGGGKKKSKGGKKGKKGSKKAGKKGKGSKKGPKGAGEGDEGGADEEDAEPAKVRGCFARVAVLMATFHLHPTLPCNFSEVMHVDTPFKKIRQLIAERYDHTVTQILVFEGEIKGTELVQTNEDDVEWDDTLDDFGVEGRMKQEAYDGPPTHTFYYDYCPVALDCSLLNLKTDTESQQLEVLARRTSMASAGSGSSLLSMRSMSP